MAFFVAEVFNRSQPDDHSRFFAPADTPYQPVERITIDAVTEEQAQVKLEKQRPLYNRENGYFCKLTRVN